MKTRFSSSRGADTTLLCLLGVQVMVQTSGQMGLEILVWIPLRVRYDKTHELHNAIAFYTSYTLFWFFALLSLAPIGDHLCSSLGKRNTLINFTSMKETWKSSDALLPYAPLAAFWLRMLDRRSKNRRAKTSKRELLRWAWRLDAANLRSPYLRQEKRLHIEVSMCNQRTYELCNEVKSSLALSSRLD